MITRSIGDITSSAIGLGCMGMTFGYGRVDPGEARATLEAALDSGVTHFDTAESYGTGRNETFIGTTLQRRRDEVIIATKTGVRSLRGIPLGLDGRPDTIRKALEGSLKRLGVAHVDIYYLHRVDPKVPVEESIGAIGDLADRGLVRHIGISECTVDQLRRAATTRRVSALQIEWSLFSRVHETTLIPAARELGIGIVPFSPLGRGFLTGDPASTTRIGLVDFRRIVPRWHKQNLATNLQQLEAVRMVAQRHDVTPGQVALAWLLSRGDDVVPIPGTKKRRWLAENIGATEVVLTEADLTDLDRIRPVGQRMPNGRVFLPDGEV